MTKKAPRTRLAIVLAVVLALVCAGLAAWYLLFAGDVMTNIKRATVYIRVDGGDKIGTGVLVTEDGYIITAASVVKDGKAVLIEVVLNSGTREAETFRAELTEHIGQSGGADAQRAGKNYALIKIESQDPLPFLPVIDSANVAEGMKCYIAGYMGAGESIYGPSIRVDQSDIRSISRGGDGGALAFNTGTDPYVGVVGAPCVNDRGEVIAIGSEWTQMTARQTAGGMDVVGTVGTMLLPTKRFKHVWEPDDGGGPEPSGKYMPIRKHKPEEDDSR